MDGDFISYCYFSLELRKKTKYIFSRVLFTKQISINSPTPDLQRINVEREAAQVGINRVVPRAGRRLLPQGEILAIDSVFIRIY